MNTAVPGTRSGGCAAIEVMNGASARLSLRICATTRERPLRQVDISRNSAAPSTSGNQPPSGILIALAARNALSMTRKVAPTPITTHLFQCHIMRATISARMVSISMVPVTAMP